MMFFNSNREQSPTPENKDEKTSIILSDATKDTTSIDSKNQNQNQQEPEIFPGTGESGMPKKDKVQSSEKKKEENESKMSSKI